MSQQIDWNAKEAIAHTMTDDGLAYAITDCHAAATAMGNSEMIGKDASYYHDEASIYRNEQRRRQIAARPWAAVGTAYGDWDLIGMFATKTEAIHAVQIAYDTDARPNRAGEIDGRHLVLRTRDLEANGFNLEDKR